MPELCAGNNEQELQGQAGVVALTSLHPTQTTLLCSLRVFSVKYSPTIGPTASGDRAARATSGARRTPSMAGYAIFCNHLAKLLQKDSIKARPRNPRIPIARFDIQTAFRVRMSIFKLRI